MSFIRPPVLLLLRLSVASIVLQEFIFVHSYKLFIHSLSEWLSLTIRAGDLLVIKHIDRLGRNYNMILDEWRRITKVIRADILVLDTPLLDTRVSDTNLVGRFISDIVLQLLSFVAENERDNIRQRQAEGIAAVKRRGTKFGRPLTACPPDFPRIVQAYKNKQISCSEAMELSQMKPSTFFYYLKRCTKN